MTAAAIVERNADNEIFLAFDLGTGGSGGAIATRGGRITNNNQPLVLLPPGARVSGFAEAVVLGEAIQMAIPERALADALDRPRAPAAERQRQLEHGQATGAKKDALAVIIVSRRRRARSSKMGWA